MEDEAQASSIAKPEVKADYFFDAVNYKTARKMRRRGTWLKMPPAWKGLVFKSRSLRTPSVVVYNTAVVQEKRSVLGPEYKDGSLPLPGRDAVDSNRLTFLKAVRDLRTPIKTETSNIDPAEWPADEDERANRARKVIEEVFLEPFPEGGTDEEGPDIAFLEAVQSALAYVDNMVPPDDLIAAGKDFVFGVSTALGWGD
jgi:hypothetical protein